MSNLIRKIVGRQSEIQILSDEKEIRVADGAEALLVDNGGGEERKIEFGKFSRVKLLKITTDLTRLDLEMDFADFAQVETTVICFSRKGFEMDLKANMNGMHVNSAIRVLYFFGQSEKYNLRMVNEFRAEKTHGSLQVRGVASNKAKVSIEGEMVVENLASGTDAYFRADSLMMGKGTSVRQLPVLRVRTNNVKAGHGVSVSKLNEEDLLYLLSRGISREIAYTLSVNGFLADFLNGMENFGDYHQMVLSEIEFQIKLSLN